MQQLFNTRSYSVRDFEEWDEKDELQLAPKFQRRDVWSDKARSYLIDTIIRGKPIPKIYMRQDVNVTSRRVSREVVDGQQRLRTVLSFIKDGFKISKAHHDDYGGKRFSELDKSTQRDILKYEFVVDLLQDMPDSEIYDIFARMNTHTEKLKDQELRNARWFGDFKSSVYQLATEFVPFLEENKIFTSKQILRMAEAEFISELLLAIEEGIRGGGKAVIDAAYKKYDDKYPNRKIHEKRFRETIDIIGGILEDELSQLEFRAIRLFYPLFCAVYQLKFGLPHLQSGRKRSAFRTSDYPKFRNSLEKIDELIDKIRSAEREHEDLEIPAEHRTFYNAYREHWVHADNRTILTEYICKQLLRAQKE
jgi:hypothetical protein